MLRIENIDAEVIRTVKTSPVCDITVCRDALSASDGLYTVVSVKNSENAKEFLSALENADIRESENSPYIGSCSTGGGLNVMFRYSAERRLKSFQSQLTTPLRREETCVKLIMECMTAHVPFSVLYCALSDDNLNISEDGGVYFNYFIPSEDFDASRGERDCANRCAYIVLDILSGVSERKQKKLKSLILVRKKTERGSYNTFAELYKDITFTQLPTKKVGLIQRLKAWFERNKERLFKILITLCVILVAFALLMLLSQLLFGGFDWLAMRYNGLDKIGTETLK